MLTRRATEEARRQQLCLSSAAQSPSWRFRRRLYNTPHKLHQCAISRGATKFSTRWPDWIFPWHPLSTRLCHGGDKWSATGALVNPNFTTTRLLLKLLLLLSGNNISNELATVAVRPLVRADTIEIGQSLTLEKMRIEIGQSPATRNCRRHRRHLHYLWTWSLHLMPPRWSMDGRCEEMIEPHHEKWTAKMGWDACLQLWHSAARLVLPNNTWQRAKIIARCVKLLRRSMCIGKLCQLCNNDWWSGATGLFIKG